MGDDMHSMFNIKKFVLSLVQNCNYHFCLVANPIHLLIQSYWTMHETHIYDKLINNVLDLDDIHMCRGSS